MVSTSPRFTFVSGRKPRSVPLRVIRLRNTPRETSSPPDVGERPPVDRLVRHYDVHDIAGYVEEFTVVDFTQPAAGRLQYLDENRSPPGDGDDVARLERFHVTGSDNLATAAHLLDEEPCPRHRRLQFGNAAADKTGSRIDGVAAELELASRRRLVDRPALHLLLELAALLGEVDAQQFRRELRQHPRGDRDADQVGDREGDRDVVAERRPVRLREVQTRDGVHGRADGRRFRERPRDKTCRGARIVAKEHGHDPGDHEARRGDDGRERRVGEPIALEAPEELRARPEADREQEQQEEALLDLVRQRDPELPHQHAREQRARHCAELEAAERDLAEQVAEPQHEEERYLRVRLKDCPGSVEHDSTSSRGHFGELPSHNANSTTTLP